MCWLRALISMPPPSALVIQLSTKMPLVLRNLTDLAAAPAVPRHEAQREIQALATGTSLRTGDISLYAVQGAGQWRITAPRVPQVAGAVPGYACVLL